MKKVLFHTGRGGRFNNSGFKTCKGLVDSFNPEYYGINVYFDPEESNPDVTLDNGEVACTLEELKADSGSFKIDNDYDTYSWCLISDLDEEELSILVRDLKPYEYKDALIESGVDANVFNLLEATGKISEYVVSIDSQISFTEFINFNEVLEFESEEAAEEEGYSKYAKINDKYYTID